MHKTQAFQPLRALQSAWDILMKAPLPMWVGGLILIVVDMFGGMGGGAGDFNFKKVGGIDQILWLVVPIAGLGLILSIVMVAVTSWLKVGYYTGVETVMRDGDVEFEQLYKRSGRWLNVFLVHLLQMLLIVLISTPYFFGALLIVAIGKGLDFDDGWVAALVAVTYLMYLPVFIYFFLGLQLMPFAAVLDGDKPVAALSKSWNLANGIRWQLILILLLQFGVFLLGCCALVVGIFAAGIIGHVMWAEAYIQATRDDLGEWWINNRGMSPAPGSEGGGEPTTPRDVPATAAPAPVPVEPAEVGPDLAQQDEVRPERTAQPDSKADTNAGNKGPGSTFDPGAWRQDLDIPPADDDTTS